MPMRRLQAQPSVSHARLPKFPAGYGTALLGLRRELRHLGVLIALAAQQWAEARSWDGKSCQVRVAISDEVAKHYSWSVEWRVVSPSLVAQLDQLRPRKSPPCTL